MKRPQHRFQFFSARVEALSLPLLDQTEFLLLPRGQPALASDGGDPRVHDEVASRCAPDGDRDGMEAVLDEGLHLVELGIEGRSLESRALEGLAMEGLALRGKPEEPALDGAAARPEGSSRLPPGDAARQTVPEAGIEFGLLLA